MPPDPWQRPYAARANIFHEFDTDHLNIWLVFRFAMDTTVKPANAKWLIEVETIDKAVTTSAWQDEWTMLLTVNGIASIPDRVTVEYDGPDQNLKTTWEKQWEPWGPILSSDSSLVPNGNFTGFEFGWSQVAAINTWYDITHVNITSVVAHKMTFQGNGQLKILVAGWYTVTTYITIECSIAGKHVLTGFAKNGVQYQPSLTHREFARANEEFPLSSAAQILLAVDDLITVGIVTTDAGNPTLTVDHLGLIIHEIGIS